MSDEIATSFQQFFSVTYLIITILFSMLVILLNKILKNRDKKPKLTDEEINFLLFDHICDQKVHRKLTFSKGEQVRINSCSRSLITVTGIYYIFVLIIGVISEYELSKFLYLICKEIFKDFQIVSLLTTVSTAK